MKVQCICPRLNVRETGQEKLLAFVGQHDKFREIKAFPVAAILSVLITHTHTHMHMYLECEFGVAKVLCKWSEMSP